MLCHAGTVGGAGITGLIFGDPKAGAQGGNAVNDIINNGKGRGFLDPEFFREHQLLPLCYFRIVHIRLQPAVEDWDRHFSNVLLSASIFSSYDARMARVVRAIHTYW